MAINEANPTPFEDILRRKKLIPVYQRDFVWEESLVENFLAALYDAFETDGRKSYFAGAMVFCKSKKPDTLFVIDGQQRITVLYTLISEILQEGKQYPEYQRFVYQAEGELIASQKGLREKEEFNWQHEKNQEVSRCLRQIGKGEDFDTVDEGNELINNLADCRRAVRDFVEDKLKYIQTKGRLDRKNAFDKLEKFYRYVREEVSVVCSVEENLEEGINVFTRLNAGGKPLGHLELIKGWLFSNTPEEKWYELDNSWSEFWDKFNRPIKNPVGRVQAKNLPYLMGEATFLTYFFFIRHGDLVSEKYGDPDGFLPANKLSPFLLDKKVHAKIFQSPDKFLDELSDFTEKIIRVREGRYDDNADHQNRLKDVVALSKNQTQPLLFLLRCYDQPKLFIAAVEIALRWIFVFTIAITGKGTTGLEWRKLSRYIVELRQKAHSEDSIIEETKEYAQRRLKIFWETAFISKYGDLDIEKDKPKVKNILLVLEAIVRKRSNEPNGQFYHQNLDQQKCHVDHLAPKKGNHGISEDIVQQIGNAALLEGSTNTALQNKSFASMEKKQALQQSYFYTTRGIVYDEANVTGPVHERAVSQFKTIEDMTADAIENRQREILAILEEDFGIRD